MPCLAQGVVCVRAIFVGQDEYRPNVCVAGNTFAHVGQNIGLYERQARSGRRLHDLRHRLASRAVALGESLPMIGKLVGHTQVQITARYAHLANNTVKASASRVGDSIGDALASAK